MMMIFFLALLAAKADASNKPGDEARSSEPSHAPYEFILTYVSDAYNHAPFEAILAYVSDAYKHAPFDTILVLTGVFCFPFQPWGSCVNFGFCAVRGDRLMLVGGVRSPRHHCIAA